MKTKEPLKPGTRISTLGSPATRGFPAVPPEAAQIMKPQRQHLPLPGPNWYIVKFDSDGGTLCMHENKFRVVSAPAERKAKKK